jgi:lysophospholipase L1-like esterase
MRALRTRTLMFTAATVVAAAGLLGIASDPVAAESNGGVRVMPLGDSITEGTQVPGGYRIGLWQRTTTAQYRVDLVGSQYNGPAALGDHDHEGHPGWRIDQIDASITSWLRTTTPRTVLLHIGTNDILQNYNVAGAPQRLSTLIDHITTAVPDADVFAATIIPLSSASQENAARTFNAALPGIVQSKVNAGRHLHLVDMHSALSTADLIDGIHPTATGYDKMAARWFSALQSVSGSIGNPVGSSSSPSPSAPQSLPPAGAGCTARYAVTGQWQGGFQAEVTVTAGGQAVSGWTVTWQYSNGQSVTQAWNATVTTAGSSVTATNVAYNGAIPAGGSTTFGLLGSAQSTPASPAVQCTAK